MNFFKILHVLLHKKIYYQKREKTFVTSERVNFLYLKNYLQIDDVVMKACSQYMRSICGDCLDKRKTDNYEVSI